MSSKCETPYKMQAVTASGKVDIEEMPKTGWPNVPRLSNSVDSGFRV